MVICSTSLFWDALDVYKRQTEDLVGPYELHDFYLYQVLRFGFGPAKIFRLAKAAFAGRPEYPAVSYTHLYPSLLFWFSGVENSAASPFAGKPR